MIEENSDDNKPFLTMWFPKTTLCTIFVHTIMQKWETSITSLVEEEDNICFLINMQLLLV